MKIFGFVSAALFVASASSSQSQHLKASSKAGQGLMQKARALNNNNDNFYAGWVADYSIKFDGCIHVPAWEREEGMRSQLLAKFRLCPSDSSCTTCPHSGVYVTELRDFVESMQEAKMEANEYNCEVQKESCEYECENNPYAYSDDQSGYYNNNQNNNNNNNNGDNQEACEYACMYANEMSFCDNDNNNNEGMDMNELAECRPLGEDNGNNNNYANVQQYYVGAYCNSKGVFVGTFTDSTCTSKAPSGTFEGYYGYSLPTEPLVTYECWSCKEQDQNNNANNGQNNANNQYGNDYYDQDAVSDVCERLYEDAGKCEKNVKVSSNYFYADNSGCDMIHSTLARLDAAFSAAAGKGPRASTVLAWVFGVVCVAMATYIYYLRRRIHRAKANLSDQTEWKE